MGEDLISYYYSDYFWQENIESIPATYFQIISSKTSTTLTRKNYSNLERLQQ